jgi:hypothetical protein
VFEISSTAIYGLHLRVIDPQNVRKLDRAHKIQCD